jgi:thiamine kinase-like enzyme
VETCELVFSHNDLLAGNVLIREGDNKVIFIDYEYSCYNYRAYDIANYFNESVIDYNVTETPFFKIR